MGENQKSQQRIIVLSQDVVNRIAAGEVVVRPVNAVKEMIENSLDAKATEITVSIRNGGLGSICVKDNGVGINREDMHMACTRHATSKLEKYEDLQKMMTYGFRGEALASISYVAKLSIISRTASDNYAHRANFADGQIIDGSLRNSAGQIGTSITAEDLFYNAVARKNALKYPNEEANRIADVVVKYAIHNPHVSFAFMCTDKQSRNFRTSGNGDKHGAIQTLLTHLNAAKSNDKDFIDFAFRDDRFHFVFNICMSKPISIFSSNSLQARKDRQKIFHLFINHRFVECDNLKKSIDMVLTAKDFLCQFMTVSLLIDPEFVDVNVHPTKSTVHFLNETNIVDRIEQEMLTMIEEFQEKRIIERGGKLLSTEPVLKQERLSDISCDISNNAPNTKRAKTDITPRPQSSRTLFKEENNLRSRNNANSHGSEDRRISIPPNVHRVRVDSENHRMDEFISLNRQIKMSPADPSPTIVPSPNVQFTRIEASPQARNITDKSTGENESFEETVLRLTRECEQLSRIFELDSLNHLRREICSNADKSLTEILRKFSLIGFYSHECGLFQSNENVYVFHISLLLKSFFYQTVIFSFGNMGSYLLQAIGEDDLESGDDQVLSLYSVRELLTLHLHSIAAPLTEEENNASQETIVGAQIDNDVNEMVSILMDNADLLWDYFSIEIVTQNLGQNEPERGPFLNSLPCVIDGYVPQLEALPQLLYNLSRVDYTNEAECYKGVALSLAEFFTPVFMTPEEDEEEANLDDDLQLDALQRLIFPLFKSKFLPSGQLSQAIQPVTNIKQAFTKFGRC
ncbi:histidine kinase-, DNA gyrase b-, and HSP90-like ATPase domain-containing protein [Ditylenchus destructor]|uniref:Histidine kinase-, DNA gyrase b-, and HSP90-like ATPase domain-containing protein n=1 Tax=Ditylenchus destructor TaxID=166010 RepID=A0AAD4N329_9BILA|nr:histidine kinase-, DNA gyrase b-, and HSP90-like ATPase domain-containing protein [Ditylenchus destructor]